MRAARLAADTLALVEHRVGEQDEAAILDAIRSRLASAPGLQLIDDDDTVLAALPDRRPGAPLVLLAGHRRHRADRRCAPRAPSTARPCAGGAPPT